MLREALRYPLAGDGAGRTIAVGALLSALGILVVPAVLVAGYLGRVLASSAAGEAAPPGIATPAGLLVHGLKSALVSGVYTGVVVASGLAVGLAGVAAVTSGDTALVLVGLALLLVVGLAALGLLWLPVWFFVPAALARLADAGSVRAALDVRAVASVATDRRYLARWAVGFGLFFVGWSAYRLAAGVAFGLVPSPLTSLTAVPSLVAHALGAGVNFYCHVAAFHAFGRGYGAAAGTLEEAADVTSTEKVTDATSTERAPAVTSTAADRSTGQDAGAGSACRGRQDEAWGAEAERWRLERLRERERARAERRSDAE